MDPLTAGINLVSGIIDKIFPDKDAADRAKLEMLKLQQEGAFKEMSMAFELAKGQLEVNKAEAASSSAFTSSWRPAIGWVCVSAYAYNYVIMPLVGWIAKLIDPASPPMIALETAELTTLLFGMLGIGGLRTLEKVKGKA